MPLRDPAGSDTDNTDDDHTVGGLGIYSHSQKCLTHQHWVSQVVSAGGFNVHCTQGPEAAHNVNMHLASARVRHGDANHTQESMLRYLCEMRVFSELSRTLFPRKQITRTRTPGLGVLMRSPFPHSSGRAPGTTAHQQSFLHREALVTGGEFMDMICDYLGLPKTRHSQLQIGATLRFAFAHKFVMVDGSNFWVTDTRYGPGRYSSRRDT